MKTKTIELYEYDELPENIKAKVLDNERYINVDDSYWHDYDSKTGFSAKELNRMKVQVKDAPNELITWKNMYFDIDRSWYIQFTDAQFLNDETARKFLRVPKSLWEKAHWTFANQDFGGNNHATTRIEYENQDDENEFTTKQIHILERAIGIFSDKMQEVLRGLQATYESLTSDEAIIDTIKANEYTFTITGKMENI